MRFLNNLTKEERDNIDASALTVVLWNKKLRRWLNNVGIESLAVVRDDPLVILDTDTHTPLIYVWITETDEAKTYLYLTSKDCLAVRKRPDGLLGVQSVSGLDTRVSEHRRDDEIVKEQKARGVEIERFGEAEAHWNREKSLFRIKNGGRT